MNDYLLNKLGIYFSTLSKNFCEGIKINYFEKDYHLENYYKKKLWNWEIILIKIKVIIFCIFDFY